MWTKFIWQLKQFFKSFPDKESWAYSLYMWWYDWKYGKGKPSVGFNLPTDFNDVEFISKKDAWKEINDNEDKAPYDFNVPAYIRNSGGIPVNDTTSDNNDKNADCQCGLCVTIRRNREHDR